MLRLWLRYNGMVNGVKAKGQAKFNAQLSSNGKVHVKVEVQV